MRGRTFALSQKELQRVNVISSCVKGEMACARLHRRPQSASQRPRRTPLGRAPGPPQQRTSSGSSLPSGFRQRRAARFHGRLKPPLRSPSTRNANRLAPGSAKSRSHLLLHPPARGQQRQHRAVGGPALARSRSKANASALPGPRFTSMKLSTGALRSITAIPACNTPRLRQGDIFILPLG
jgi:hypothetical protein